jgi:hypothetical protein
MFDLAASKMEALRPDLAVIAFVGGDLSRGRFWRSVRHDGDRTRWLVSPDTAIALGRSPTVDVALVDPGVTWEWCEGMLAARSKDVAAGSSNIQRNIIGERGLGLPRNLRAKS